MAASGLCLSLHLCWFIPAHGEVFILFYRRGHGGQGRWADLPRGPDAGLTPPRPPCAHSGVGGSPSRHWGLPGPRTLDPEGQLSTDQTRMICVGGGGGCAGRNPSCVLSASTPSPAQIGSPRRVSACGPRPCRTASPDLGAVNTQGQSQERGLQLPRGSCPAGHPGSCLGRDHPRADPDLA